MYMKKKKLALLMVAALTFTNLDGTVVAKGSRFCS